MTNEEQEKLVAKEAKRLWKGRGFKIAVLAVTLLLIFAMIHVVRFNYHKIVCRLNLYTIHNGFIAYANDFDDELPPLDAWNDLMIKDAYASEKSFRCPGSKTPGRMSDYSLNTNLPGDAGATTPGHAVFLFESVPGWNQSGNSDIFDLDNHNNGAWYNTLSYPEGYFIKPADIDNIKWKPDQIESPLL